MKKITLTTILWLVFAACIALPVWAAGPGDGSEHFGDFAAMRGMDNAMPGGARSRAGAFGYGMADEPEMAELMRDIMVLHQINRVDLTREQIGQVLPILRNLDQAHERHVNAMHRALREEKARLLAAQGTEQRATVGIPDVRSESAEYRAAVESAKADLAKVLSAPQAAMLGAMITPPGFGAGTGVGRAGQRQGRGPEGRRAARAADDETGGGRMGRGGRGAGAGRMQDDAGGRGQGRMQGRGGGNGQAGQRGATMGRHGAGMGMGMGPVVDLERLIDLLAEKRAAMR